MSPRTASRGRLTSKQDAFGRALWDHYQGHPAVEIYERDDGFMTARDFRDTVYLSDFVEWPLEERKAMSYVRGRVLDVGCGAGRACLYLQERGREVVGIDVSPVAIKLCIQRGVRQCHVRSLDEVDHRLGTFDTVLFLGNNLGLLGTPAAARRHLRLLGEITSDRGRIIGGCLDPYQTKDTHHLDYHRRNRARGRPSGQLRIRARYGPYSTPWISLLWMSVAELEELLEGTGWQLKKAIDVGDPTYVAVIDKAP